MKKIILSAILMIALISMNQSAVKVNFFFTNLRLTNGYLTMDIRATILAAQVWRVGSCNFRLDWVTVPASTLVDSIEAHTFNANPNIDFYNSIGNPNYGTMTTTSISGGTAISMNVVKNPGSVCYRFNPGTYTIGSFRFRRLNPAACGRFTIRTTSVVYDSLTLWANVTDWTATVDTTCYRLDSLVGVNSTSLVPKDFKLYTNYPNPFNPVTTIRYDVPRNTNATMIIYDMLGKEVEKLINGYIQAGSYEIVWDASNYASGTYFYRFEADQFKDVKKMQLIK
jgi:type IX secretion system substrate protein